MIEGTKEFTIVIQEGEDWGSLAIALMKQGYAVNLYQDFSALICKRAWIYHKKPYSGE